MYISLYDIRVNRLQGCSREVIYGKAGIYLPSMPSLRVFEAASSSAILSKNRFSTQRVEGQTTPVEFMVLTKDGK